jgi:hypothetical protein
MTPDELERILSAEDGLEPSSGFAAGVLAAARRSDAEASARGFPWLRFVAGVAASGVMALAGTVLLVQSAPALATLTAPLAPLAAAAPVFGYATAAVLLSLGLASVTRLLTRS